MKKSKLTYFLIILVISFCSLGQADIQVVQDGEKMFLSPSQKSGRKFALLVGVERYEDKAIFPLQYAVDDVQALASTLTEKCFYKISDVEVLLDEKATRNEILKRLDDVCKKAGEGDTVLVYFSGHGVIGGLLTYDSQSHHPESTSLTLLNLMDCLRQTKASKVLIFDAGYSGGISVESRAPTVQVTGSSCHGTATNSLENTIIMASCAAGQCPYEDSKKQHGIYSYYLIEGLRGGAKSDDGAVNILNLQDYVETQTQRSSLGRQQPVLVLMGVPVWRLRHTYLVDPRPLLEIVAVDSSGNPVNARIAIDGKLLVAEEGGQPVLTPVRMRLAAGTHTIIASREGFLDGWKEVNLVAGSETSIILSLRSRPALPATKVEVH